MRRVRIEPLFDASFCLLTSSFILPRLYQYLSGVKEQCQSRLLLVFLPFAVHTVFASHHVGYKLKLAFIVFASVCMMYPCNLSLSAP